MDQDLRKALLNLDAGSGLTDEDVSKIRDELVKLQELRDEKVTERFEWIQNEHRNIIEDIETREQWILDIQTTLEDLKSRKFALELEMTYMTTRTILEPEETQS